jgi:outer membrane protein TolC
MKSNVPGLLAILLVSACTTYEDLPLDPADALTSLEARNLADQGLRRFLGEYSLRQRSEWPLPQWDLEDLTLAAFFFHPDLEVARATWAVASAGSVTAAERSNPVVGIAPSYNTDTDIPTPWIITSTIDQPLNTGGKRQYRIAQAAYIAETSRFNIASVAWQVRSRLRRSLLELYSAEETSALLTQQRVFELQNIALLESQYRLGAISSFELTRAHLLANSSQLALLESERKTDEARVMLADAIGIPVHAMEGVSFSFKDLRELPDAIPDDESRVRALTNRADILGALSEYAAAQAGLQLQIARQFPDINIGPGFEFDQGDNKWALGFSMTLPVLNQNQGAIAEAFAARDEAAARFIALQARVLTEIDLALSNYRAALKAKELTESMLAEISIQRTRAQATFAAGDISKSDLIGLNLQLSAATLSRFGAIIQAQQAAGSLEDALQVPFDLSPSTWETKPISEDPDDDGNQ